MKQWVIVLLLGIQIMATIFMIYLQVKIITLPREVHIYATEELD